MIKTTGQKAPVEATVTWEQVAALRLKNHYLLEQAPADAILTVTGEMAGAQAQLQSAAYLSFWARTKNLESSQVETALSTKRLVKASCMRRTLFLVPSEDLAIFVRGATRRAEKELNWARGKGVPERTLEAAIAAALGALDQPRTREEIAVLVCRRLGVESQNIHGGGWGSRGKVASVPVGELVYPVVELLHLAAARGVICYGPNRGQQPTFVRADAWIPGYRDLEVEEAEGLLLRRYLHAYGPANPEDFAMWSGLTLSESRAVWSREESRMAIVSVEGSQAAVLREDLEGMVETRLDHTHVNLLPHFDTYLLGHRDRRHLVDAANHLTIYRPQGWIVPVLLVDGRAAGIWEQAREGNRLRLKISPFAPLARSIELEIQRHAADLARFLAVEQSIVEIL